MRSREAFFAIALFIQDEREKQTAIFVVLFSSKMRSFFQHLIQIYISLQIIIVCSVFMKRGIEHRECQYPYSTNNEKPSEVCDYEWHSSNPIDFIKFLIQKSELTSSIDYPFHTHFNISLWLLGLSIYLFCLTTFSEAEKAKSSTFYIVKRLIRLIITILIAPFLFLLLPRIVPTLLDRGLVLHYLFSNRCT